ncbi:MAG TPA: CRISPR-associated protein Csx3 [Cyanobacteria bacterium UBA11149]|nr:CRISPR-associated protein Csx3 [Cyanobacteria bacterium UBA11367]HBE59455.1 CRISPR-associated protein Csx3 [Cyanobacteria bacterium UBA11366]HBK65440.1 CRISPR-associated protein Csx3 [Cyanobacteria bacterium UBA11166]HBR77203.1 CRISPR-associated protein Csx3 [Cyanobacteria bacterium UBA11159]HBS72603.1 CRISPR-associated protein Csx3 [Cyanobacteria bacterium UBA11153]HBW88654.1 CRISPR-associated protein Csx3 [Cyanobacteria bacterium UBA11149]HCA96111.1 CRISPR-associated protein Csx3 [Cyanob
MLRDAESQLQKLTNSRQLPGGKILRINGRTSILASFLIASKVAHQYGAIAMFDPKMGDKGIDKYIITISHSPNYQVGQTFDINYDPYQTVKAVLCGPPNTGKTVLRDSIKEAIFQLDSSPNDFYAISGCPDGDGAWFSETAKKYPEVAAELKKEYKAKFTPEFAKSKARDIKVIKNSLLLFDVGGKITPENKIIMPQASHAIILAKTEIEVKEWQVFCQKLNLPVIAIIYSDINGTEDKITSESPILTGNICQLKRGADVSPRPMVQALANLLVKLTKS